MFVAALPSSAVIFDDGNLHSDDQRVGGLLGFPACSSKDCISCLVRTPKTIPAAGKNDANNNYN